MVTVARESRRIPTIVEHRALRFGLIFLLYVAQGLPIGVFLFALPAWLAANGASALVVGSLLGAATLPWSLKFVNGFIMDRIAWLPMGRRRPRAWLSTAWSWISRRPRIAPGLTASCSAASSSALQPAWH